MNFFYKGFSFLYLLVLTLTLHAQIPKVNSFTPSSGPIGTVVTIAGTNFSSTPANNIVFFGAVRAIVSSANSGSLTVTVPAGASLQPIAVTVNQLTAYSIKPFIVTFAAGNAFDETLFSRGTEFSTAGSPYDLAIADFDGDGKPDIVTTDISDNKISVLRNITVNDSIKMAAKQDFTTGLYPYGVAIADLTGDGKLDIAVVNYNESTVSVFINISTVGNISFASKTDFAVGTNPTSLCIGDIDLDGKPDILTANYGAGTFSFLRNSTSSGMLAFAPKIDRNTGSNPNSIAIADMDGDNVPDIAIANFNGNNITVIKNNSTAGNLSLAADANFNAGGSPYWINISDYDNDGKMDIAVSDDGLTRSIRVLKNTSSPGNLSFTLVDGHPQDWGYMRITSGDINGDGKPDIAFVNAYPYYCAFAKNVSQPGSILISETFVLDSGNDPKIVAVGDLNADGKADAVVTNSSSNSVSIYSNKLLPGPVVASVNPSAATKYQSVTITGSNFTGATEVSFGGTPAASFSVVSSSLITAIVGNGASGTVEVKTAPGTGSIGGFIYIPPKPKVTSFDPAGGTAGETIHIYGKDFVNINAVTFGGVPATYFFVIDTSELFANIGTGASGYVKVSNSTGADSIAGFTFYYQPVITSFSPALVTTDDTIIIKGHYLTGASYVRLGGAPAASFSVLSDSIIKAVVGAYNNLDNIYLITPGGEAVLSGYSFYVHPPIFNSFTPNTGDSGTIITITGKFLSEVTAVTFGGMPAQSFSIINDTTIQAVVGNGVSGNVSVKNITAAANRSGFVFIPTVAPPIITSFTPLSGNIGTTVILTGSNFSNTVTSNAVFFGAVRANVTAASSTSLSVTVPPGASYGAITVTVLPNKLTAYSNKVFNPVFSNSDTSAAFVFKQEQDLSGLNDPRTSAIADFDGDGKPDIAVTNYAANTVSVFRNTTGNVNVTFGNRVDFSTLTSPYGITTGDINGDGKIDIVITHFATPLLTNSIGILKNTSSAGNISFAEETFLPINIETQYSSALIKDWDANGKPDIAATDYIRYINPGAPVSIFQNAGSAGNILFSPFQDFVATTYNLDVIRAGDLDGDGKSDLIVNGVYNKSIAILKNNSSGNTISFIQAGTYPIGYEPGGMDLGDVDGDGQPDIVTTLKGNNVFSVFRNTSAPGVVSFAARVDFNTGPDQEDILLSDLDGDTKPDIVLTKRYFNSIHSLSLFKNKSIPGSPAFEFKASYNTGTGPLQINAGDLNGDGRPEIISVNSVSNSISVFRNKIGAPPSIYTVSPSAGSEGAVITIKGENFYNVSAVSFGNMPAASFIIESDSIIKAVVGNGSSGNINVISPLGNVLFPGFTFLNPKFVTQNGAGSKNGSSWANAWGQTEFSGNLYNQQVGTSVWIAKGTYKPSKDENGAINANSSLLTFSIPPGVRLYGGFAGNEISLAGRKNELIHGLNTTRLSADIGAQNLQDDNCAVAVTINNSGQNEVIDGITISNAKNNGIKLNFNAGVISLPSVNNCIIADNSPSGAGLLITGSSSSLAKPLISNCIFSNNHSTSYGAVSVSGNCAPVFNNCVFYKNGKTNAAETGASCISFSSSAGTISNCSFFENALSHAAANGAAIILSDVTDSVYINNSIFWNNYNSGNVMNLNVVSGSNKASVKNCIFQTQAGGTPPAVLLQSVNTNPDFINADDADGLDNYWGTNDDGLLPQPYSNAVDAGNNSLNNYLNSNDIADHPRLVNNTIDIGAYEVPDSYLKVCGGNSFLIRSALSGSSYQWQLNAGAGFINITNNSFYAGAASNTLQVTGALTTWYGYKYRCIVGTDTTHESTLRFSNAWTGAINNSWENSGNWSCGSLPDANTDVVLGVGSVVLASNVSVKSLSVEQGVVFSINSSNQIAITGGALAAGSLGGSPGNCTAVTASGVYKQGVTLIATNILQVQVNITVAGPYFISTNTVNGVSFSKAGIFTGAGIQNITLNGTGTPELSGNQIFTVRFNTSSCSFTINFSAATPDYFPMVPNSHWSYKASNIPPETPDSVYKISLPNFITFNGQSYRQFSETNEFLNDRSVGYRKNNNDYYTYYDQFDDLHSLLFLQANGEIKLLNDNLPVGSTWISDITGWVNGESQNTPVRVQGSIEEKAATVTLTTGLTFPNVIKTKLLFFDITIPSSPSIVYAEERWYALGIGLIYFKSNDPYGVGIINELKRYVVY